ETGGVHRITYLIDLHILAEAQRDLRPPLEVDAILDTAHERNHQTEHRDDHGEGIEELPPAEEVYVSVMKELHVSVYCQLIECSEDTVPRRPRRCYAAATVPVFFGWPKLIDVVPRSSISM